MGEKYVTLRLAGYDADETLSGRDFLNPRDRGFEATDNYLLSGQPLRTIPFTLRSGRRIDFEFLIEPEWLLTFLAELKRIDRLELDWDTYGGKPIEEQAIIGTAQLAIWNLKDNDLPKPWIIPTSQGGVALEWESGDETLEVVVAPSGAISAFAWTQGGEEIELENLSPLEACELVRSRLAEF